MHRKNKNETKVFIVLRTTGFKTLAGSVLFNLCKALGFLLFFWPLRASLSDFPVWMLKLFRKSCIFISFFHKSHFGVLYASIADQTICLGLTPSLGLLILCWLTTMFMHLVVKMIIQPVLQAWSILSFNLRALSSPRQRWRVSCKADNLFSAEDSSQAVDSIFLISAACDTEADLTGTKDDFPQLYARGGASCAPSKKPHEDVDPIINIFQDPEGSLRQEIPSPGQTSQPEEDDNFNFESLLNNRPVPSIFEEDAKTCRADNFGLSSTPVCLNDLRGSAIRNLGNWFTLYDVEPRRCFPWYILRSITSQQSY